jgi:predicted transcriptional regulator
MSYKVKDYMERSFLVTDLETPIHEAAGMIASSVHDLIVIMEKGIPRGFVSAADIVSKVIAVGSDPASVRVKDIMTTPCLTIDPDDDLMDASEMIRGGDSRLLVVIKNGVTYGVVTPTSIALRFGGYVDKAVRDVLRYSLTFR